MHQCLAPSPAPVVASRPSRLAVASCVEANSAVPLDDITAHLKPGRSTFPGFLFFRLRFGEPDASPPCPRVRNLLRCSRSRTRPVAVRLADRLLAESDGGCYSGGPGDPGVDPTGPAVPGISLQPGARSRTEDGSYPAVRPAVTRPDQDPAAARLRFLLEERHGTDTCNRLIAELQQPCVTFAAIAKRMGVTRERVRQWQMKLLPEAPRGHDRQRLCAVYRKKRLLLEEPLFRRFYQHARAYLAAGRIELIKSHQGYRTRSVRIDRCLLVLCRARRLPARASAEGTAIYALSTPPCGADFVYYQLTPEDYLLVPASEVPAERTTYLDRPGAPFRQYKNRFDAVSPTAQRETA
jgi:hypothetical protein